jgi:hypothetical protein
MGLQVPEHRTLVVSSAREADDACVACDACDACMLEDGQKNSKLERSHVGVETL